VPLRDNDPSRVGRYRLIARLGAGGMGVVYLGQDLDGAQVAVKVLRPELADDPEFRVRFGREVSALMRVRGACTVRVIEADTDGRSPFMVTEYAEGPSLADYIDATGPLGADMLYGLATGLAEALTAIHAAGVVHRDLKPSNVILGKDGPKVIDFGIAHALGSTHVTRTGVMVGSAGFMAPEQISGRAGQAADIFAWGVTIAHAASGRSPFGTGTAHAILYRIMYDEPDIAAVPDTLRPLVMSALAKDPLRRPAARELLDRLTRPSILSAPTTGRAATPAQTVLAQTWAPTDPGIGPPTASPRPGPAPPRPSFSPAPAPAPAEPSFSPAPPASRKSDSLLLEPASPRARRRARRGPGGRRTVLIAAPAVAAAAVAAMVVSLMTGHGLYFGPLAANQQLAGQGTATVVLPAYPGQQQRGVFQTVNRIVASGSTMVTIGSQSSDGLVRQQFFVSTDSGASWRLAPVHGPGGGQAPIGHAASLLAGGPGGWLAIGPQAIWASRDGTSWTLAAAHGVSPQLPGDSVWVITKTARGYLAAGKGATGAVVWTSRDGLTWQRMTAAQLGLPAAGEAVPVIAYATYHGDATVISGQVTTGGVSYSGAWLSTDGGAAWTRVTIPEDHGAKPAISGLGFDGSGLLAVRPGVAANGAPDGVAYFSQNGQAWQYAGTIGAAGGWSPGVVKGSDDGFVVTGTTVENTIVAYTSTGTGGTWRPTGSLGDAGAQSVIGATVAPRGTVVAVGYTAATKLSQQLVQVEADTAGAVRPVRLAAIPGGLVPELAVNGLAAAGGQMVAVGSANGYPAAWRKAAGGSWSLVTPLSLASSFPGLTALTSVTKGPAGWLAVGAPGPVVLTSSDGITWRQAGRQVTQDLAGAAALTAAAGPAGYVIARTTPGGGGTLDLWWSRDLTSWTRATSMNDTSGDSRVLAVAADGHGFLAAGSHDGHPAVWSTSDGRSWTAIVLGLPAGASSAVLQQVAVNGDHVVVLGQQRRPDGTAPLAETSANGGLSWQVVPFPSPGPDAAITALAAGPGGGFTAAARYGAPGQQQAAVWMSPSGTTWTRSQVGGLTGGGASEIAALAQAEPSSSGVVGIGAVVTQASQQTVTVALPAS
jgi:serine/threonine protein kinase